MRDTVATLEADFTQFQIITSGDIQQLKDKLVQQDNLLKLQKKTMDDIASDFALQIKSLSDDLQTQSILLNAKKRETLRNK